MKRASVLHCYLVRVLDGVAVWCCMGRVCIWLLLLYMTAAMTFATAGTSEFSRSKKSTKLLKVSRIEARVQTYLKNITGMEFLRLLAYVPVPCLRNIFLIFDHSLPFIDHPFVSQYIFEHPWVAQYASDGAQGSGSTMEAVKKEQATIEHLKHQWQKAYLQMVSKSQSKKQKHSYVTPCEDSASREIGATGFLYINRFALASAFYHAQREDFPYDEQEAAYKSYPLIMHPVFRWLIDNYAVNTWEAKNF